jgi:hypothetical protein
MMTRTQSEAEKRRDGIHTPTDGKPFYCTYCGSGWDELMHCEDVRCVLETKEEAMKRFVYVDPPPPQIGDYSDIMDEPI